MEAAARTFSLTGNEAAVASPPLATSPARVVAADAPLPSPPAPRFERNEFAELVDRHQQAIYGYMRARLLEPADADDLCQEVFLRSYTIGRVVRRNEEMRFWLLGIARNVLHEYIRGVKRRREVKWTELCLELDALIQDTAADEDEALTHLPNCLESLGKSARDALEMQYHAKLKMQEIGTRLKRSEGAVKLLLYRARQALKHCLDVKLLSKS